jgi:Fe-Mn family superoxide dismutase
VTHELPKLPYATDALEPYIDALTVSIHHDKHHQTYVNNLNAALEPYPELARLTVEDLLGDLGAVPEAARTAIRNNGGGVANHNLYWSVMGPGGGGQPSGDLAKAIDVAFGSFDAFCQKVTQAGLTRFGSGYGWLSMARGGALQVESTPNQDSPVSEGRVPLLTVDVWEHAYYLKYQNRRNDHIAAWWNAVRWDAVAQRYADALARMK